MGEPSAMRKIAVGVASLLALSGAGLYVFLSPSFLEWRVERACPQITGDCAGRVRALAHILAYKGETERALHWYRKGAEAGDPMSMFHLAWMVEQKALDQIQAKSFEQAALGKTASLPPELRMQLDDAASWYRKSADKGFAPAMNNLGQAMARGTAGARNPQAAAHYYRLAAQAGNPVAGFNLALAHLLGDGVTQSASEAGKWLEWSPARKYNQADLQQPTLERTRVNGGMLAESMRKKLRDAAEAGPPATAKLEFRPLQPAANLPTFEQARRQSGGPVR
jgi:TPR repeat protein